MLRLKENSEFYGSAETFLFLVEPELKQYAATLLNQDFMYSCKEYFLMGSDKFFRISDGFNVFLRMKVRVSDR